MKVFILLKKDHEDYSSITSEKVFVFDRISSTPSQEDFEAAISKMALLFDSAEDCDRLIPNGPSWVILLAGYIWLGRDDRKTMGIMVFNNLIKQYTEHSYAY